MEFQAQLNLELKMRNQFELNVFAHMTVTKQLFKTQESKERLYSFLRHFGVLFGYKGL